MMYKIIQEGKIIDVVRNPNFIKFLASGHIAITDKSSAQGIIGSDTKTAYSFGYVSEKAHSVVKIAKITLDEFNRLHSLLNSEKTASKAEHELTATKAEKIALLSNICKDNIIEGFSVILRDKNTYYFRLTTEDQLNLLNLENQLNAGAETLVYHSTAAPCKVFIREDVKKIINAYRKHVLYHTTYFNTAKQYINSLTDIDKIIAFDYGFDISGYVKDPAVRKILQDGGAN